ncbi:MAG: 3-phosphoshikimate 1-carboxyvinyltransferase [Planctomycetia bacterium]
MTDSPFVDPLPIPPARRPVQGEVRVPGSKSYTNRALPAAALAAGVSTITGLLDSEDTRVMMDSLRRLGVAIDHHPASSSVRVAGADLAAGGSFPNAAADLFLANSGTSMRFLTAVVAVGKGVYTLDGVARMRERPIGDLLAAMTALGVDARSLSGDDCPPVVVRAAGLPGGAVSLRGDVSSQFLSALLLAAPCAAAPLTIRVVGPLVSKPYVDMTLAVVDAFGGPNQYERDGYERFAFRGREAGGYKGIDYAVEPDASAASYFFAAAAVTGGRVTVPGLGAGSLQGDLGFVQVLEAMGCRVVQTATATTVVGGELTGVDVDLCHLSDTVPTLAAVACFARTPTRIRNVKHIRVKETDRLAALTTELRKTGVGVEEYDDGLLITPVAKMNGATFDTYRDHRMAMSLALVGLKTPGVFIRDPGCTHKTYPAFFADLARVRG